MRRWLRRAAIMAAALVAVAFIALLAIGCGCGGNSILTAARFSQLRSDPTAMRAFLGRMPKGADLHVHLSGAVYAEDLIKFALANRKDGSNNPSQGPCFQLADLKIVGGPCDSKTAPPIADALEDQGLYDKIINALSMRAFVPSAGVPGHDHFFAVFRKTGSATEDKGAMIAEVLRRYAADSVQYTELMVTLVPYDVELTDALVAEVEKKEQEGPAAQRSALDGYINEAVPKAKAQIEAWKQGIEKVLQCKSAKPDPGCGVSYRFIAQVRRNSGKASVFAQTAFAAELVRKHPEDVVGLNFVEPEDYQVARADYRPHMDLIRHLAPDIPVALHAGELWLGVVPPEDLKFHIRAAIETGGARRIGHGTSLAFEERGNQLLADMAQRKIAVEISLTSNDMILGVRGKDHPLMAYWSAGVPVALSTDNAGVERIDLSNEYVRAARDYGLSYRDLKAIARNSLTYSFLADKDKRDALARFDTSVAAFERSVADERSVFGNMGTLIGALFAH